MFRLLLLECPLVFLVLVVELLTVFAPILFLQILKTLFPLLLLDNAGYQVSLYQAMIKAMHAVPASGRGRGMFYAGAAVSAMLDLAAVEKHNAALGMTEVFGVPVLSFRGRPIRTCDAILETEAEITFA